MSDALFSNYFEDLFIMCYLPVNKDGYIIYAEDMKTLTVHGLFVVEQTETVQTTNNSASKQSVLRLSLSRSS